MYSKTILQAFLFLGNTAAVNAVCRPESGGSWDLVNKCALGAYSIYDCGGYTRVSEYRFYIDIFSFSLTLVIMPT